MRYWINEDGVKLCEPNCVEEWLKDIWMIGCDYDGCNSVDSLKGLVDELVDMANKAQDCLSQGRLTPSTPEVAEETERTLRESMSDSK